MRSFAFTNSLPHRLSSRPSFQTPLGGQVRSPVSFCSTRPVGTNPPAGISDKDCVHTVMIAPMTCEESFPPTTKWGMPPEFELSQRTDAPLLAEPFLFVSAPLFAKMTFSVSPAPLGTRLSIDVSGEQRVHAIMPAPRAGISALSPRSLVYFQTCQSNQ